MKNITFNTNLKIYYYIINDDKHNNVIKFVCPELFTCEQFRDLKDIILEVEFGKEFSEKPLVRRNPKGYNLVIGDEFKFEVRQVVADPNTLRGVTVKEKFPYQWLKGILTELLIPQDEIVISSWNEFVKGCNLLNELEDEDEMF